MRKISLALFGLTLAAAGSAYAADSLSFQVDCNSGNGEYTTGTVGPAFKDGKLTSAENNWNVLMGDFNSGLLKLANNNGANIRLDFTAGSLTSSPGTYGLADATSGIYDNGLMRDWFHTTGYNPLGVKITGLTAGKYRVYALTREFNVAARTYDVAIGTKLGITTAEFPTTGITSITDATGITDWQVGKNYAFADLDIADPNHYVSILVKPISDQYGTLQGFQVVDLTPNRPTTPVPANGAEKVLISTANLSWTAPTLPGGKTVGKYEVFMANSYSALIDSTRTDTTGVFKGETTTTSKALAAGTLAKDSEYFWRVDALFDENGDGDYLDPNEIVGSHIWSFKTELSAPIIGTQPNNAWAVAGETVKFTTAATDPLLGTLHYTWYQGTPTSITKTYTVDSPELSLVVAADDLDKSYFCRIANGVTTIDTRTVTLETKALKAYWPMDSVTQGSTVAGSPLTSVTGTAANITQVTGVVGGALNFASAAGLSADSTGGYFDFSYKALTVCCWVKTTNTSSWLPFVSRNGENSNGWQLRVAGNAAMPLFSVRNTSGTDDAPVGTVAVNDGTWHFVVGSYDGINRKLYVDGRLNGSIADTGTIGTTTALVGIAGRQVGGTWTYIGNTAIDEVRIYNYPLSATEVANLYFEGPKKTICLNALAGDLDKDCDVDLLDFQKLAVDWLDCNLFPECISVWP